MKRLLTPRELAEAIGASESSVKRWVDAGHIEAARTAGGHRRISLQEATRYVRQHSIPLVRPDVLGLAGLAEMSRSDQSSEDAGVRFFEYLREGAEAQARSFMISLYLDGSSIADIIDGPFREALARLGKLWIEDRAGILWEHRATQIAMRALSALRSLLKVPDDAPVAVGGAPEGDRYILPSMAVAAVLEGEGIRAVNLGAETPVETLSLGVADLDARLAWLSVSVAEDSERLRTDLVHLLPRLAQGGIALVVGGAKSKQLKLPESDSLYVGRSMAELEALVKGMKLSPSRTL